jgi:hypothetical protein
VPVLPNGTRLWGFMLTNYFWSALPKEIQSLITENRMYKPPDMLTFVTKTIQLNELWKLCEAAVQASQDIFNHNAKLSLLISEGLRKHQPYVFKQFSFCDRSFGFFLASDSNITPSGSDVFSSSTECPFQAIFLQNGIQAQEPFLLWRQMFYIIFPLPQDDYH